MIIAPSVFRQVVTLPLIFKCGWQRPMHGGPANLSSNLKEIPHELKARHQWVCWRSDKIPVDPKTGKNAKANDPGTWGTFEEAVRYYQAHQGNDVAGVGFEFSQADPYVGVDLDKCQDADTGKIKPWARDIIEKLNSYTEISPSGRGVHILVQGKLPPGARRKGQVEMYSEGRYFTVTGQHLEGTPPTIEDRQAELEALHQALFGQKKQEAPKSGPSPIPDKTDAELIEMAKQAANGEKFSKLWGGDISEYGNDDSAADFALCLMLAFWTGKDPEQMDRLFRMSGLMRDKWDRPTAGSTYGTLTIDKAISQTTETYNPCRRPHEQHQGQEKPQTDPTKQEKKAPTLKTITARELEKKDFPPRRWVVPDLITDGLTILAGRPKTGKSWMSLSVAAAVASGGKALGKIQVEQGEVLYLGLEDSERRIKERLKKIVPFGEMPAGLHIATAGGFPPLQKGGMEALEAWLKEHPSARLVVIDTLARVKPARKGNQDAYDHDTAIVSALQRLSIEHQVALVVIHHTRKNIGDDFLEEVSGTFGLTGAADCVAVLVRKARGEMEGTLKLTGRDIEEKELALRFCPDLGLWELMGEAREFARSQERQDIYLILKEHGPLSPKEVAEILGKNRERVKALMWKMEKDGELTTRGGRYSIS